MSNVAPHEQTCERCHGTGQAFGAESPRSLDSIRLDLILAKLDRHDELLAAMVAALER